MQIFLISFLVMGIAVAAMAVGVIFSNRAIKGSCGGIANVPGMEGHECKCNNPCENKKKRMAEAAKAEQVVIKRF